ncbi:hypothetical protein AB0953_07990 [Streptomyces sp. NPDC046866]|uniref:hypothetical protein n=1 Tax=Streptomyces sp. NPDC046866 TaxID=3154921 RepID=UPI00345249F1
MRITIETTDPHDEPVPRGALAAGAPQRRRARTPDRPSARPTARPSHTVGVRDAGPAPVGLTTGNGLVQEPPAFTQPPPRPAAAGGTVRAAPDGGLPEALPAGPAPSEEEIEKRRTRGR